VNLYYEDLGQRTRQLMLDDLALGIADNRLVISPCLSGQGVRDYPNLQRQVIESGDDASLATALTEQRRLLRSHTRRKRGGGYGIVLTPPKVAGIIAESEFNHYYIRALARRAIGDCLVELVVVRAWSVTQPRPQSEALVETSLDPRAIL
jgi:hypothetical protein